MGSFLKAKREHRAVKKAAAENANLAANLWNAILGLGAAPPRAASPRRSRTRSRSRT